MANTQKQLNLPFYPLEFKLKLKYIYPILMLNFIHLSIIVFLYDTYKTQKLHLPQLK